MEKKAQIADCKEIIDFHMKGKERVTCAWTMKIISAYDHKGGTLVNMENKDAC